MKVMATLRQKALAKAIVMNSRAKHKKNKQDLVASVGYSEMSADKKATEIIESKGTQQALETYGFTEDNAKKVVSEIMQDRFVEAPVRLKAADMIFEVHGTKAATKSVNVNVNSEDLRAKLIEDMARFRLKQ